MGEHLPPNFTAAVCTALLGPMLWNRVPRSAGILNALAGVLALVGFHWWWYVPIAVAIHFVLRVVTAWDPYFVQQLGRCLSSYSFYEA